MNVSASLSRTLVFLALLFSSGSVDATEQLSPEEVQEGLARAVRFFHEKVANHGGYLWRYSGDLQLQEAEGKGNEDLIWVQPPGTPTVGEAFLDAYEATGDDLYLNAARDAAQALVSGQLHSGGWFYRVTFDRQERQQFSYRYDLEGRPLPDPAQADGLFAAGWADWKRRKYKSNITTLDDDTTQAALRFLIRLDGTLKFENEAIHEAALYGLASVLGAQYANGAWSANYDRFPHIPPDPIVYPVRAASYPEQWPRTWPKDFTGCYVTNDDLMPDMIGTLLRAADVYQDQRYRQAAERAGDFLLLAQMPDPQPAWAQQYDRQMQPVWSRAFEPPAISGRESQYILEALLLLYQRTGQQRYLEPIPRALRYLRQSHLEDGQLARFYELQTNSPLYFRRAPGGGHEMTYSRDRLADHYAFVVGSRLERIQQKYDRLVEHGPDALSPQAGPSLEKLAEEAKAVLESMDERGAWVEAGLLDHHDTRPASGVIDCATFARNVRVLSQYLSRTK